MKGLVEGVTSGGAVNWVVNGLLDLIFLKGHLIVVKNNNTYS